MDKFSSPESKDRIAQTDAIQERLAFWVTIALQSILLLVVAYFLTIVFRQPQMTIPVYAAGALFVATLTALIVSMFFVIRQRREESLKLLLRTLFLFGILIAAILEGRTLTASFSITSISALVIAWLMPRPRQRRFWLELAVAMLLMWVIEWISPPWRIPSVAARVGPLAAIMFAVLLTASVLRQYWRVITSRLQLKIVFWTGTILAAVSVILIGYSAISARQAAIDTAENQTQAIAVAQAGLVRANAEIPLDTARTMAQALTAIKDPSSGATLSRDQVNAMLKQVLIENTAFLGTYTLWEPNAFDGQDALYRGAEAHDETGRFIPYWVRADDGSVSVIALIDYETPGIGDWYLLPRQSEKEVTIAPLIYPINGIDTVMASFVAPIVYQGKFYGIAGVDAPISFVQKIVDDVDLYDGKADAVLMTSDGTLIGVRNHPEMVNHPATEIFADYADLQANIQAGETFASLSPDGNYLRVFAPVDLGRTGIHWTFGLTIPFDEITAPATTDAIVQGTFGLLLAFLGLATLWALSRQIVRPVLALTDMASAVSKGNLNVTANVLAVDETGLLANAFNLMITQLRESFARLEERVAERTRNLELAAEVGRTVSRVRTLDVMLTDAAELIRKQFDLYYVQVYLADSRQEYLNLKAGTGQVGRQLLDRNHRLPIDVASINGRAALERKTVSISDTTASATFKPNPLLPDTRSEMAVPLLIGENVVGVLDMQSERPGALDADTLPAFEALAGQLAIAIQNAGLLAEAEEARREVEAQARRLSRTNWAEYLDAIHTPEETGYVFEHNAITPLNNADDAITENALSSPITVSGEALGNLIVELADNSRVAQADDLVAVVARQVAQQIENLRLLESAERYRDEAEQASRRLTRAGWQEYLDRTARQNAGFLYDLIRVRPFDEEEARQAEEAGLSRPLKVGGETIGKLVVQGIDPGDEEASQLTNAVAERLSAHIEGLRLTRQTEQALATTRKQAEREQALRQITSAVRSSTDPAVILRTATRELGSILGRQTIIQLETKPIPQDKPTAPELPDADGGTK